MRVLLVSSFVLPHAGGVERFVAVIRERLERHACEVRVLACRRPGEDGSADAVVPARYVGPAGWPLPTGGARTVGRELAWADVIIANNAVQPLSTGVVLAGRRRGVPALMVIHGSGVAREDGPRGVGAGRAVVQRTLSVAAVRRALPVSVSRVGVTGVRREYGVLAAYLPFPLPELPAAPAAGLAEGEELRVMWTGRLAREKDPLLAVEAIERLRATRPARLDMFGDGPLRPALEALASERPWLSLRGARPWPEVLAAHERAHACLSTSGWDNVQVAVLEALARGVPVVSTRVGDAPSYYRAPSLERFCVPSGDARALAEALGGLGESYPEHRRAFADNGRELAAVHRDATRILIELIGRVGRASAR